MSKIPTQLPKAITDKYSIENETFFREVKPNPKDRIEIEIGDSKQPDFKPQFKLMRRDNEVNFSLRAEEKTGAIIETEGEKIKYITPDYEIHLYDKPEITEDGGFEFEWVLPKKPATNVLTATIQTKELNFFYQPPLTQKEIDEGEERPENVVGSYAVYHKTKGGMNDAAGMEYKVGKAFHIYRPKVTDANGDSVWGELNIDEAEGLLTVTIDRTWLDNAVYPVRVDPTFGYTTAGATAVAFGNTVAGFQNATSVESGTVTSISAYRDIQTGTSAGGVAIYNDLTSSPNALLAQDTGDQTITTTAQWLTWTISSSISAATYWLAFAQSVTNARMYRDTGAVGDILKQETAFTFENWQDPENEDTTVTNRLYSIYATYTAAGGGLTVVGWKNLLGVGQG